MKCVGDVMTHRVITVHDRTPFKDVARLIRKHGVSALPVVDQAGRLLGIVSEADLMLKEEHAAGGWVTGRLPSRGTLAAGTERLPGSGAARREESSQRI